MTDASDSSPGGPETGSRMSEGATDSSDDSDAPDASGPTPETIEPTAGNRVVLTVYAAITVLAGIMGYVLGVIRPNNLEPRLFFVIDLPPTPLGVAIYGFVTVGVGLGVLLGLVLYVSDRYDTEAA